jgi:thiol-disulfide isomerase/thioredoxin
VNNLHKQAMGIFATIAFIVLMTVGLVFFDFSALYDTKPTPMNWLDPTYTDVLTGTTFSFGDFSNSTVLVQLFSPQCSACESQQNIVRAISQRYLEVVPVSISTDLSATPGDVVEYAQKNEFGWRFVVVNESVLESLKQDFSAQILSPSLTSLTLICPNQSVQFLGFGLKEEYQLKNVVERNCRTPTT